MAGRWLLLLHQIPPRPPYFRAKVLRRLNQLGALAVKKSAYVLPASEDTREDFQWLIRQIVEEGGEAWLFQAEAIEGYTDASLEETFRAARGGDYAALAEEARTLLATLRSGTPGAGASVPPAPRQEWARLQRRSEHLRRIDFFDAAGREELEVLMAEIHRLVHEEQTPDEIAPAGATELSALRGRTWVTRSGVKIDRMASAWLIRRFIDPAAAFIFVDPKVVVPDGTVRFDMYEGDFTHEGNRCTFEVLLARSGLDDQALHAIGQIVHDIDLKDDLYDRAEAAGVAPVIEGIVLRHADDTRRLEEAGTVFDALYARLHQP